MSNIYGYREISEALSIEYPLLMLDQAEIAEDAISGKAYKLTSANEHVFAGHFPGQPILPGVLQVAAMVQLAKLIHSHTIPVIGGSSIVLKSIRRLKFRKPVFPGMRMDVEASIIDRQADGTITFQVACNTEAGLASAGTIALACVNPVTYDPPRTSIARSLPPFADKMTADTFSDSKALMKILPHRPPFLLVDGAYGLGTDATDVYGYKNVTGNDLMLASSVNRYFPACLLIESGAQLGCAQVLSRPGNEGKLGIFMSIDEANFYHHIFPGDRLCIHAVNESTGRAGMACGQFYVDDILVADCKLKFIVLDSLN